MYSKDGFETERKFLIEYPDTDFLTSQPKVRIIKMEQAYIKEEGGRIRKTVENGEISFVKTVKKKLSELTRKETEWEISEEEYNKELSRADEKYALIKKVRYAVPYENNVWEIDVFDFMKERAYAEIELESENEEFIKPPFLKIIKEVTFLKGYSNRELAKKLKSGKLPDGERY